MRRAVLVVLVLLLGSPGDVQAQGGGGGFPSSGGGGGGSGFSCGSNFLNNANSLCVGGQIDASQNWPNCDSAVTVQGLDEVPDQCPANQFAQGIDDAFNANCSAISAEDLAGAKGTFVPDNASDAAGLNHDPESDSNDSWSCDGTCCYGDVDDDGAADFTFCLDGIQTPPQADNARGVTFTKNSTDCKEPADANDVELCFVNEVLNYRANGGSTTPVTGAASALPASATLVTDDPGECGIDTTSGQFRCDDGIADDRVMAMAKKGECTHFSDVSAGTDNASLIENYRPGSITITAIACRCVGTCSTPATFTLEDVGGNAMTITGTNPTCATTGDMAFSAVTAGNVLNAGEGARVDVTNTPIPSTDEYNVCVRFDINAD